MTNSIAEIALIFPGQGSQFIGMGKSLAARYAVAREVFEEVDDALRSPLSQLIFHGDSEELTQTRNAQPAIMAVSIAVFRILKALSKVDNIKALARVAAGHSLGEWSALCAAGSFSLAATAQLLRVRGEAMQEATTPGSAGMIALLGGTIDDCEALAKAASSLGVCDIANDNIHGQVVLSGDNAALDYVLQNYANFKLKRAIKLNVSGPFHSKLIAGAAEKLEQALRKIPINMPEIPIIANFSAKASENTDEIINLLTKQVANRVRWRESLAVMHNNYGSKLFVELGPNRVLTGMVQKAFADDNTVSAVSLHEPEEIEMFLEQMAKK